MIVKHRRGTTQEWHELNLHVIPEAGELIIEECDDGTRKCKIGTGFSRFSELPYIDDKVRVDLLLEISIVKESIKNRINSLKDQFLEELDEIESDLKSINTRCYELQTDYITRDANLKAALTKNLADTVKLLKDDIAAVAKYSEDVQVSLQKEAVRLDAKIQQNKEKAETDLTTAIAGINSKFADEATRVDSEVEHLDTKITTTATEISAKLDTKVTELDTKFSEAISNSVADYTDKFNKVDTELIKLSANIATEKTARESAISDLVAELRETAEEFDSKLATTTERIEVKLSDSETATLNKFAELEEKITENKATADEAIADVNLSLLENVETLRSATNLNFMEVQAEASSLATNIQELDTKTLNKFIEIEEAIKANADADAAAVLAVTEQIEGVNDHISATEAIVAENTRRINKLLVPDDSTLTRDEEVIDIRVGYNGVDHASAGDAVRAIGNELDALKASLPDYIPSNAVDGLHYENNQLWLTSKDELVGDPVTITGGSGGGGSISTVKVTNNLPSVAFTVAKGNETLINFTYTSFENEVPTGDGVYAITINDKNIDALSGSIQHGVAKILNVADYLKNGANKVKVTCSDQYGSSRSLVYTISVVELRIESSFTSAQIFNDTITFRYKVFGQIEKTALILVDGEAVSTKTLSASVSGNEITLLIPKQVHGCHKITAYVTATIDENTVESNILEYEVICVEPDNNEAIIASIYKATEATQGDLISIPYMIYDPVTVNTTVDLIVYAQVAGDLIEINRNTVTASRDQQLWNTRNYPTGNVVFAISYTYSLYGVQMTITKMHAVKVEAMEIDVEAEEDSLQLYLTAQGRSNNEQNPAVWEFTQTPDGDKTYDKVTTTFEGFNWKSNGWVTDTAGDTCLRLNGDAKAIINFKPFEKDFKTNGKTIEFEFVVRDVNDRDAIVIDCFDGSRGFRATPDTAFLKSSGSEVSCRYKDEERVRVAIAVEHVDTTSRFVSIYLDGVLSGVQRYAATDIFSQDNPLKITLGSSLCGLDVYNIRVYDKALETPVVLQNFIADQTVPSTRLQLVTNNDILDENNKVSYDRVKALGQIPIITFTGPMPTYKGDKKKKTTRMKFEDPANPEMNFDVLLDQIDVQGTSSQFYIRKNWKVKLPEARAHMPGAIPAKVFCIKVDYAEATGTHNTGAANYIETLYDREVVTLPPQKDDTRVRTTVQGFPIIIFEKATEDSEPVFSSKGNFNYDKDAENAFGFTKDYKDYGVECWEFCNNTSDPVNFAGEIPAEWLDDFEPRYVPESANFERIEELQEIAELAASGKGIITEAQKNELATLMRNCIANFKEVHDWVLSTATYTLVDGKRVPMVPTPLTEPVTYGETTYTEDNEEYRLAKFKYEFRNYFNMHYTSMYYVFTFFALMTDQRAKNLFLTRWKEADGVYRWYPYFYDNDTIFGINNEGALVFDYFHEDTDQLGSSNVFNGQNSVLWNNFRLCFPKEIEDTYSDLRNGGKLAYNKIIDQFVVNGSDKYSEAIYNADADYKYVSMARENVDHTDEDGNQVTGIDASNLYQVRGTGEQHLRYFIANRLNYCDSKWYAGSYPSDDIFLRIYTPKAADDATQEEIDRINASLAAVPANPAITITPFSDMYAGVRYKSGTLQQKRLKAGEEWTFRPINENETFGDTETAIYGAGEISSLGDLSGLYCGVINLSNAAKLTELTVGNADPAYYNDNFREISVGNNRLLRYIDLRNCSGLGIAGENPQKTLELSGCPNIEHIYTEGTNLASVDLPDGGYIKTLHLPRSLNTLVIKNHKNITDFYIESYENIRTLYVENSNLNTNELLEACRNAEGKYTVERVRLTGIEWGTAEEPLSNADFILSLVPKFDADGNIISGIRGIDEKNNPLDDAYLVGTCYIEKLTGEEYTEIKSHYPYLDIKYGEMTSKVTFMSTDSETVLYVETVTNLNSEVSDCADPVLTNKITKPTKESTDEFDYEWIGWSRKANGELQVDALLAITGDRLLYPVFRAIRRNYIVTFMNSTAPEGNQLLAEIITPYGNDADYFGAGYLTPTKQDAASPELYTFTGWHPAPVNITSDLTCYAQFTILDNIWYTLGNNDITSFDADGSVIKGYILNKTNNTMEITECYNNFSSNPAIKVPDAFTFDEDGTFAVTGLGGFSGHNTLEFIKLPSCLIILLSKAFAECKNLSELELPESLCTINTEAFRTCKKLKELIIPANVSTIADTAFAECSGLTKLSVAEGNKTFEVIQDCLIDTRNSHLIQGLATSIIPQDGSVKSLGIQCFSYIPIKFVQIPEGVTSIPSNAFSHCEELQEVVLPSTIRTLDATCFTWCYKLSKVNLPEGLTDLMTYVFNSCALEDVVVPASVNNVRDNAFGNIKTLKTVTFNRAVTTEGAIKQPYIHFAAFSGSGSQDNPIMFNLPWSEEQHYSKYSESPAFGAKYYQFNFDYEEAN